MRRACALLDLHHLEEADQLRAAFRKSGRSGFQDALVGLLGRSCPVSAYALAQDEPELFNLTSLRHLYKELRKQGHLDMAYVVLNEITRQSGLSSDASTLENLYRETRALELVVGDQLPSVELLPETALVFETEDSVASHHDEVSTYIAELNAAGADVILCLLGNAAPDLAMSGARLVHVPYDSRSSLESRVETLVGETSRLINEFRPSIAVLSTPVRESVLISQVARSQGVRIWWNIRDEELASIQSISERQVCPQHISRRDEHWLGKIRSELEGATVVITREEDVLEGLTDGDSDRVRLIAAQHSSGQELPLSEICRDFLSVSGAATRNVDTTRYAVSMREAEVWTNLLRESPPEDPYQWFDSKGARSEDVIRDGWTYEEFEPIHISPEMNWEEAAQGNRSWGFHLHAWEFMDSAVQQFREDENLSRLEWCIDVAASWRHQLLDHSVDDSMAWYDMALAWRSPRLAGLVHLGIQHSIAVERMLPLYELVLAHVDAHLAEDSFAGHNNHGYYAALGQLVLSRDLGALPRMSAVYESGARRMKQMAETQFLADGGHAEHSPDYHRMLLKSFERAIAQGLIADPEVIARIERASDALGWFVMPNSGMLQFGDSPQRPMTYSKSHFRSETTNFVLTDGRVGKPEESELLALPDTGYAIVRSPQPRQPGDLERSSYLAFMAAFHSRAHKHCDDLSLVWSDCGREILVDGGRYGYGPLLPKDSSLRSQGFFYADPERQFIESVWAHNTVTIDGQNYDRRRQPYGSGLLSSVQSGEEFHLAAEAPQSGWWHRRELAFLPGERLRIKDIITAEDSLEHEYSVFFNFEQSLMPEMIQSDILSMTDTGGFSVQVGWSDDGGRTCYISASSDPLRGWRSTRDRSLEPTWHVERSGRFKEEVVIVTELAIASKL